VERTRAYSKRLGASLANHRQASGARQRQRGDAHHRDVTGKDCIIVDDMIDTAGTLCNAARAIMDGGARSVVACAIMASSRPGRARIEESPLEEVVVTNSVLASEEAAPQEDQVLVDWPPAGEAIRRIHI